MTTGVVGIDRCGVVLTGKVPAAEPRIVNDKGRYRHQRATAISKPQPYLQNACVRASRARMYRLGSEIQLP